ncbi:lipid IV(A) 3-deoxy-D-manno-octulosonic acid transferase [Luteimonas sp. MC1750]|uniref:lipid IV(A) 3-deoxy-D-manno-octulosonic acid transferase n=1 Tax=Luteimonas sp. MC1750 TaxID=2799326 RepID=UPI0018F0B9B0|nr:lipid IV(A) 3-deoxy-D-manno-octulosonic acid transferase [Luteimonas sp. MC1750]MBJ6984886.1 lipid IV(A) 3-deoxy-D-manno-octulosonic acid transferase [Luteimonas sp. MC1750]QQO05570.1 lipid IV(A) 3-deoxy-D-manno-octulosonic acid transferase [Luteimonas sp. MC1750]
MEAPPRDRAVERLLRGLYSAMLYVLAPVTVYHLIWRGFRQAEYLERWGERYAAYRTPPLDGCIWVHAVSVGEVNAAAPLVNALLEERPDLRLLVTTITPTGSMRVRALWGDRVEHVYLPYDLSGAVRRFLAHFRPRLALVLETELWPNLLFCCRDHGVPAYLVNARLSERSLRGYRALRPLVGRALRTLAGVAAQSDADAGRFVLLGAHQEAVSVLGNLKFDIRIDGTARRTAAAFATHSGGRRAWIAASTHPEEEAAVIAMHRRLRARWPDLLLLWAPRHPERFRPVAQACVEAGWRVATRKLTQWPDGGDDVFVIDTLGELVHFYACAEVAFVGGSLQAVGGHNLLEPAALGVAVVTGPHLHNFADIAQRMDEAGALRIGADADAVVAELDALLGDEAARAAMVVEGQRLVKEGRGALALTLDMIRPALPPA